MNKEEEDEEIKRTLRDLCGFEEPEVAPPISAVEEASQRALDAWELMMANAGIMPDILNGGK